MIDAPKQTGDYPDRELECEEALEPYLLRLIDDDVAVGMSRVGAAKHLAAIIVDPGLDIERAESVIALRDQAIDAGWKMGEVDKAMRSLGWYLVRAADPGAPEGV